mmetsp:Transcript_107568/g.343191  ORF Transcript_107568/g.343191 Transcript_107568/m.343191 type:complete len:215 (-) Transcript_107568:2964-3608(-)
MLLEDLRQDRGGHADAPLEEPPRGGREHRGLEDRGAVERRQHAQQHAGVRVSLQVVDVRVGGLKQAHGEIRRRLRHVQLVLDPHQPSPAAELVRLDTRLPLGLADPYLLLPAVEGLVALSFRNIHEKRPASACGNRILLVEGGQTEVDRDAAVVRTERHKNGFVNVHNQLVQLGDARLHDNRLPHHAETVNVHSQHRPAQLSSDCLLRRGGVAT